MSKHSLVLISSCILLAMKVLGYAKGFQSHHKTTSKRAFTCFSGHQSVSHEHGRDDALYLPSNTKTPIRTIAAPMVAASDFPFRCLCRQYGVDLAFTQMLHSKNLCHDATFRENHVDFFEVGSHNERKQQHLLQAQERFLNGYEADREIPKEWQSFAKGPLIVQLAGDSVEKVVRSAEMMLNQEPHISGFDLNCGCPQGIARRGNYGAFLMEADNGELVCQILKALRQSLPSHVTVSAKIRLPIEEDALEERIRRLVGNTNIDFLTIHGRNLRENKTLVRAAHLGRIREAVNIAHSERPGFPVVSNGGIEFFPNVEHARKATGATAIMSSESLLETPQLFQQDVSTLSQTQRVEQQFRIAREYLQWTAAYPPLPGVVGSENGPYTVVKGHLLKILHRYVQEHRDILQMLAGQSTHRLVDVIQIVDDLWDRYKDCSEEDLSQLESSDSNSSWYRRHWNAHALLDEPEPPLGLSIQDRKEILKQRIAQLKAQREQKVSSP